MLYPANTIPGEAHKLSDGIDPSSYIQTVTSKGIKSAIDGIEYQENIEVDMNTSELRADIKRELIKVKNLKGIQAVTYIRQEIFPLIRLLNNINEESEDTEEIEKNEKAIKEAVYEISNIFGIPTDYTYEEKIDAITNLSEKYSGSQNKRTM